MVRLSVSDSDSYGVNTTLIGNKTEGFILAALLSAGHNVLTPFGGGLRYDLAIDTPEGFKRVQCKTGIVKSGAIRFKAASWQRDTKEPTTYRDSAGFFGVYCPTTKKCYLVPVKDVGVSDVCLRLDAAKNGQVSGVRWAKNYEI